MKGLIFTYGLTYGGAALSLVRPYYGLLIYVCFAILRPEHLWRWSLESGNYSRIVAAGLLIGWAGCGFGKREFGASKPFLWALVGYWGWTILSAALATNQTVAWSYIELHAKILLPVLVGLTLIDSVAQLRQLAWVIVLSLGFLAFEANLDHFQGGFQVRDTGFGGMDNNSFCIAMAAGSGLSFFLGLHERAWWQKLICLAIAGLMVHVTMFGNSRGGMLGVLVTGAVTLYLIPKRPLELSLVAVAALFGLRLAGPEVWARLGTVVAKLEDRDFAAGSRLQLWADAWDVMQKNPLVGVGPDHWPLIASQYGWPAGKEVHSLWFNAGAEFGFPGLALLLLFYGVVLFGCLRLVRRPDLQGTWSADSGRMVVAALTGFAVSASFVSLDALEPPYYVALLGAGTLKVLSAVAVPECMEESNQTALPLALAPTIELR
jgi:probable O-glycosylation ligase (exosortase A-associated)